MPSIRASFPNISVVQVNVMACANLTDLILECQPAMMFLLVMDVPNYGVFIAFANRKDALSGLPMEMAHLGILLLHGPLGLVFLFRSITQGYTWAGIRTSPSGL